MGKSPPDLSKSQHSRQLNIIYFVDSARTRSLAIPLGRLKLLVVGLVGLVVWAIGSGAFLFGMVEHRVALRRQLQTALSTIFDYETRDDHVLDLAYPQAKSLPEAAVAATTQAPVKAASSPKNYDGAAAVSSVTANHSTAEHAATAGRDESGVATTAGPASEDRQGQANAVAKTSETGRNEGEVSVGHAAVERSAGGLELRFDLSSKNASGRVEGYIYAVAEFKPDQGDPVFIGAPLAIAVQPNGEPTSPLKAAPFAIRRFKQKRLSFPLAQDRSGVITGVRIVILDRAGVNKSSYSLPAEIRIGQQAQITPVKAPITAPKPG